MIVVECIELDQDNMHFIYSRFIEKKGKRVVSLKRQFLVVLMNGPVSLPCRRMLRWLIYQAVDFAFLTPTVIGPTKIKQWSLLHENSENRDSPKKS